MKKRLWALLLSAALCLSLLSLAAFAAPASDLADVTIENGTISVSNGAEGTYIVTVLDGNGNVAGFEIVEVGSDGTGEKVTTIPGATEAGHDIPGMGDTTLPSDPGTDPTPPPSSDPTPTPTPGNQGGGWYPSTPGTPSYSVGAPSSTPNGKVTLDKTSAKKGDTVTITATPDKGYKVDGVTVRDANGNTVSVSNLGNNKYSFTMPDGKVSVNATFVADTPAPQVTFTDVPADAFYADAVAWAVEKGITNGTSATQFSPNAPCTRAQIVTFLWRAMGSPVVDTAVNFTDVPAGEYYAQAVAWAVSMGITNGTSATEFSPNAPCTRAQAVTFLHRAEGTPAASAGGFSDVGSGAYYANAVSWAVSKGVTNGTSATTFSPDDTCTRGQIVTFLYRDMA